MADHARTTCDVKAFQGRFIDYALAVIGYAYEIEDNYSGYAIRQFWDGQRAWTFADGCRDKSVLTRYKLGKPQTSVLREIDLVAAPALDRRRMSHPSARFGPGLVILWLCEMLAIGPRQDFISTREAGPRLAELLSMRSR